jgi:RNA polymerase sigma factor (sigma-70 family)
MSPDDLTADHVRMARRWAWKYAQGVHGTFRDDLYSAALEELTRCASRYDPERGIAFTSYAYFRVTRKVWGERARLVSGRANVPGGPLHNDRRHDTELREWATGITTEIDTAREACDRVAARRLLGDLKPLDAEVVYWYYGQGLTLDEIGERLGVTASAVSYRLKRIGRRAQEGKIREVAPCL